MLFVGLDLKHQWRFLDTLPSALWSQRWFLYHMTVWPKLYNRPARKHTPLRNTSWNYVCLSENTSKIFTWKKKKRNHFLTIPSSLAAYSYLSITTPPYRGKHLTPTLRSLHLTPYYRRLFIAEHAILLHTSHRQRDSDTLKQYRQRTYNITYWRIMFVPPCLS